LKYLAHFDFGCAKIYPVFYYSMLLAAGSFILNGFRVTYRCMAYSRAQTTVTDTYNLILKVVGQCQNEAQVIATLMGKLASAEHACHRMEFLQPAAIALYSVLLSRDSRRAIVRDRTCSRLSWTSNNSCVMSSMDRILGIGALFGFTSEFMCSASQRHRFVIGTVKCIPHAWIEAQRTAQYAIDRLHRISM
jgi:hypothetical protein